MAAALQMVIARSFSLMKAQMNCNNIDLHDHTVIMLLHWGGFSIKDQTKSNYELKSHWPKLLISVIQWFESFAQSMAAIAKLLQNVLDNWENS